jgi:Flp pilus assembly protein CpaB
LRHRYLLRLPLVWWGSVAAIATTAGLTVESLVRDAQAARDRYGRSRQVVVVRDDVDHGDTIRPADVALESRPDGVIPGGALSEPPIGRLALVDLVPGEVLVSSRVAPDGLTGVAALVPDKWRAVAVPATTTTGATPVLDVGDRVDVLVTLGEPPTVVVADDALVVDVSDETVTVAVPRDAAPKVAFGVVAGGVTLALRGP